MKKARERSSEPSRAFNFIPKTEGLPIAYFSL